MTRAEHEALPTDYAIPPGETLAEWLEEHAMTQGELATRIGKSTKMVNQVINGVAPLLPATAVDLETVTNIPARTWLDLEATYQEDRARVEREDQARSGIAWLKEIPTAELRKRNLITADPSDGAACLQQTLRFFGTASVESWRNVYLRPQAAFRQSAAHSVSLGAVATWLRIGELEAETQTEAPRFNADALRRRLTELRQLIRQQGDIGTRLKKLCREAGVLVLFVPDVKGTRASGATHWMTGRPIVQLSLRGKTDDRFWFTFFHEVGHVLLHARGETFIEGVAGERTLDDDARAKEQQADTFAADLLIPPRDAVRLRSLKSLADVEAFAEEIGVSPGVVVGRLHNDKLRDWSWGANLKARVDFVS